VNLETQASPHGTGKVKVLLPNQYQQDNIARANYIYRLPSQNANYVFKAKAPVGVELIKAIATLDAVNLYEQQDISVDKPFKEFAKGAAAVLNVNLPHSARLVTVSRSGEVMITSEGN
jgi:hypothetical protein